MTPVCFSHEIKDVAAASKKQLAKAQLDIVGFCTLIFSPLSHVILCVGVTQKIILVLKSDQVRGQKISKANSTVKNSDLGSLKNCGLV